MEESNESDQFAQKGITNEDAAIAIDIFQRALSFRPYVQQKAFGEDFAGISLQQIVTETLQPRAMVLKMGPAGQLPCLFFRFVGEESPVLEAIFYPFEAILSFLAQSRSHIQWLSISDCSDEEKEAMAQDQAVEMTLIMLDSFYFRSELMMDSFISEVIGQWRVTRTENILHFKAERGDQIPRGKNPDLVNVVKAYGREVNKFWKDQGQAYSGGQKVRFVREYDEVWAHWKLLRKMSSDYQWREYAKAGKFHDTPEDLLEKLHDTDRLDAKAVDVKVSELALEHAGRRARIVKKLGVSESVKQQRKAGVRVTGYTSTQLFKFLQEGRQIIDRVKEAEALENSNEIVSIAAQGEPHN